LYLDFDYRLSKKSNLPFIHYHGTPETKDEMEKKNAMDTYNLDLTNYMDDEQRGANLIDHEKYHNNNDNTHSVEIPFYWVIDVDGRKQKTKNPHARLRKSKYVTYKKSYHKSPVKLGIHNDREFDNRLKKKKKRSTYNKLHSNHNSMKKLDDQTSYKLKVESSDRLSKNLNVLRSKQSKKTSSHKIYKRSSNQLTGTNIDNNISIKNSNELYKKVSRSHINQSDKHLKLKHNNKLKIRSNSELDEDLNDSKNIEDSDESDESINHLKQKNHQQKRSRQSGKKPKNKFKKLTDKHHSDVIDKPTKSSNKVDKSSSENEIKEESIGDESDEKLNDSITNEYSDVSNKHNNHKKKKSKNKIDKTSNNRLKQERRSNEELNYSVHNGHRNESNKHGKSLKNKQKKQKSDNRVGKSSMIDEYSDESNKHLRKKSNSHLSNKLKEEPSDESDEELNDSINKEDTNVSSKNSKISKNNHRTQKSSNKIGKESSSESDEELNDSIHNEEIDESNKKTNNLKKNHQHQKSNSKKVHKLKDGSSGESNNLRNKASSGMLNYSHKKPRNKKPRKKLETKKNKKDRKFKDKSDNKSDKNTKDATSKESIDDSAMDDYDFSHQNLRQQSNTKIKKKNKLKKYSRNKSNKGLQKDDQSDGLIKITHQSYFSNPHFK